MARFVFTLAPVLRQREIAERDAQAALAAIERERLACESRIVDLQRRYAMEHEATRAMLCSPRGIGVREHAAGGVEPRTTLIVDLRQQAAASHSIARYIEREAVALSGIMARHEQARMRLAEASMRRRAMEILRDRAFEAWRREESRREALVTDDIVTAKAASREEREP